MIGQIGQFGKAFSDRVTYAANIVTECFYYTSFKLLNDLSCVDVRNSCTNELFARRCFLIDVPTIVQDSCINRISGIAGA